ncbi:MAG: DNA polymerase, partial [Bilophila sp.]
VLMWDPASKDEKIVTLQRFVEETGLTPAQWPDVQAVIGDSSDNIPGVRGVGQKTAEKIFRDYPTLEAIRDGFDTLPPAWHKKFEGQLEAMFLYRKLTTLNTEQCAEVTLDDMVVRPVNRQEAATLLREFELHSLERELAGLIRDGRVQVDDTAPPVQFGAQSRGKSTRQLSLLDTPTAAPRPRVSSLTDPAFIGLFPALDDPFAPFSEGVMGVTVAVLDGSGEVALAVGDREIVYTGSVAPLVEALSPAARIVTPDVKALLHAHPAWKTIPPQQWFDLGLASYLLEPEDRDYGWPRLAALWGTALELSVASPGLLALAIAENLQKRLSGAHLLELMERLELPLIPVLADMESAGVVLDSNALTAFLEEVQKKLDSLTEEVYRVANGPFNIRSAQQLGEVLFTHLQLPAAGKTRGGQVSTSQDVLEKLSGQHPVVDALLEFRKLEKLRSTYLEPLPRLMGADGRIRTTFNQLATATGRLSSSNPNLQNIPVRGSDGRRMRSCFTAPAGKLLISADYSQVELRVLAHLSRDETLLTAFREGADIHARTAGLLYDVAPSAITPDQRRNAKTINFGLIYGMGPQKLAQEL